MPVALSNLPRQANRLSSKAPIARFFYIVLSGNASAHRNGYQVGTIDPGQFIGEVGFICSEARTATAFARNDMLLLKINRQNFQSLPIKIRETIEDKVIEGLVDRTKPQQCF
jgi:CRP/FNR family cyclic AMP-dependent transcriptional regulator